MQNNKTSSLIAYFLPRSQDIFFISILLAVAFYGPELFNLDGDLGRHITIGKYIITNKIIPTHDLFSYTMKGEELVPHEWLAQVLFSAAHSAMGLNGVVFLTSIVIALTFTLTYREMVYRSAFRLTALFTSLWAAMSSSLHILARPHIFTMLFLAVWAYQLEHVMEKKFFRIWIFPLLMLIWANTHGAFIAGFVVLGAYIAEWLWDLIHGRADKGTGKSLFIIGVTSFAVTFINPSGYKLWTTSVGYIGNTYLVDHTIEYMAPNFHLGGTWPFLLTLAFFLFSLGQGAKLKLRESILLSGWTIMALYSARNIPLFAIVTAPMLGRLIQAPAEKSSFLARQDRNITAIESQLRGILFPVISVLLLAFAFAHGVKLDTGKVGNQYDPAVFPVNAVNWLEENPQKGNVFNSFTWGGYLLYREWPDQLVFIDGQTDFYGEKLTKEYEQIISTSNGWDDIFFNKYIITWVIIPANSQLGQTLKVDYHWRILYEDNTAVILRR
ncbi:MAG: hypothetical protein IPJ46_24145 [Anaerolineales bacterium]|nr:hypothetical protein [Anaerolineales bacterium]